MYQSQNTLFGPHDTSRVSESDLHPFSSDGNLHTCAVYLWYSTALNQICLIAGLPEQRGLFFSDDEQKMEIDMSKTHSLMAVAKITLFEVEVVFLDSSRLLNLCGIESNMGTVLLCSIRSQKGLKKSPRLWLRWRRSASRRPLRTLSEWWVINANPAILVFQSNFNCVAVLMPLFCSGCSICPLRTYTLTRMPSSTHLQKCLR